jgi:hypothetical protein
MAEHNLVSELRCNSHTRAEAVFAIRLAGSQRLTASSISRMDELT